MGLATAFTRTLAEVRGTYYTAKHGFSLYPTSGTNYYYAYSRHLSDSSKPERTILHRRMGHRVPASVWTEMQGVIK